MINQSKFDLLYEGDVRRTSDAKGVEAVEQVSTEIDVAHDILEAGVNRV
jgi:hypothetical protein